MNRNDFNHEDLHFDNQLLVRKATGKKAILKLKHAFNLIQKSRAAYFTTCSYLFPILPIEISNCMTEK